MARNTLNWHDSEQALGAVAELMDTPFDDSNMQLSALLQSLIPHTALAILAGSCARSPMTVIGDGDVAEQITSGDLSRLAAAVPAGEVWIGEAPVAGADHPVAVAASGPTEHGAVLLLVRRDDTPVAPADARILQRLWDVLTVRMASRIEDAAPGDLSASHAAASERARVVAELSDVQAGTLTSLLGTLRTRDLDDRAARRAATDLAAAALVDLRASADRETEISDESAQAAFAALQAELGPLARYSSAEIEFAGPDDADVLLSAPIAQAARAIVRRAVLTLLEQGDLRRIRVSWELGPDLVVTVRDDGTGDLSSGALALQAIVDRARALGGGVDVESVPGWGTRVLARLPLSPVAASPITRPLDGLGPREIDVLEQLAHGRRNREIAEALSISENTVKFHVANVLNKLGVHSRGEAAALAREAGMPGTPLRAVG